VERILDPLGKHRFAYLAAFGRMTVGPEHSLPFGCYGPSPLQSWLIAIGGKLPRTWAGRRAASLIRSVLKRYSERPIDLVRLGSRMRLYPRSNASEKRLMATPQFFDAVEITLLEKRLTPDFVFLDVGANAGAYTLFVANRVGRGGRIIAVEPHPTALARLNCNLALNEVDWAKVVPAALSDHDGSVSLFVNERNIGSSSVLSGRRPDLATRAIEVQCRTLTSLVREHGLARIDAIKLDVEGAEDRILVPYLSRAPHSLRPRFLIIEDNRSVWKEDLLGLLRQLGYITLATPNSNLVLRLNGEAPTTELTHGS
jgi:FkbM family methyltransferase